RRPHRRILWVYNASMDVEELTVSELAPLSDLASDGHLSRGRRTEGQDQRMRRLCHRESAAVPATSCAVQDAAVVAPTLDRLAGDGRAWHSPSEGGRR